VKYARLLAEDNGFEPMPLFVNKETVKEHSKGMHGRDCMCERRRVLKSDLP